MSGNNSRIRISWSDLPKELLEKIAKHLPTETDTRRFRAVCTSWRSSTAPFPKFPPLHLPFPFAAAETSHPKHEGAYFTLTERTVFRVESPGSEVPRFWLVKIEDSGDGKLKVLSPVSDRGIQILPEILMPKVLDTLDFRVSEVCKAYGLRYVNPAKPKQNDEFKYVKKVVVSAAVGSDGYVVVAIDNSEKLWYMKSGGEKWTMVCEREKFFDVVNYKGRFYGLSRCGSVFKFGSVFDWEKIVYNIIKRGASRKHLVELCNDELFLVEEVTQQDKQVCTCYDYEDGCLCNFPRITSKMVAEVIVSRIDKRVEEWVETKAVNDKIIFVGDDCSFSFSAREFQGCKGTRVFYTDPYIVFQTEEVKKPHYHEDDGDDDCDYGYNYWECDCYDSSDDDTGKVDNFIPSDDVKLKFRGLHSHSIGVCDFETGKIGSLLRYPEFADIFWPPPSWLCRI